MIVLKKHNEVKRFGTQQPPTVFSTVHAGNHYSILKVTRNNLNIYNYVTALSTYPQKHRQALNILL